ncbi:Sec63 Brl domain-containing protein [Radiomyces spectabilis]|uniref:Sec63 Brl domain-containing protein n=1 Tax=Radiomyces spectabilis TaxID=64574 RepID=UPI00221FE190|nr:Sec63 Brl domain-containing protein [Radiomyces spectabilis]KAI8374238.1 Sec63 Brl domain-containing protein [Radiomyces spectabilis]
MSQDSVPSSYPSSQNLDANVISSTQGQNIGHTKNPGATRVSQNEHDLMQTDSTKGPVKAERSSTPIQNEHADKSIHPNASSAVGGNHAECFRSPLHELPAMACRTEYHGPLRSTLDIPHQYRGLFPFKDFDAVQSACLDSILYSGENLVLSLPMGSRRSTLLDLAIVNVLHAEYSAPCIIYIAPSKLAGTTRAKVWEPKFCPFNVICKHVIEEEEQDFPSNLPKTIICTTTAGGLDRMMRRSVNTKERFQSVKLLIIDEIRLIGESEGSILEACICRLKRMAIRFRLLIITSALSNLQDIGDWFDAKVLDLSSITCSKHVKTHVYGVPFQGDNVFQFEKRLDWKLFDVIQEHEDDQSVLIVRQTSTHTTNPIGLTSSRQYCSTRKSAESACNVLKRMMDTHHVVSFGKNAQDISLKNGYLSDYVRRGIAFYHAGVSVHDRRIIERLYLEKSIRVVAMTITSNTMMKWPAHIVIVKSTKEYCNGHFRDYTSSELLQLICSAGRSGLDIPGCAIILTKLSMEDHYRALISNQFVVESSLHRNWLELLLPEICLGHITDMGSAVQWLSCSFLHIRLQKNPNHYYVSKNAHSANSVDQFLRDLWIEAVALLEKSQIIAKNKVSCYEPTGFGKAMNQYKISLQTITQVLHMKSCNSILDMLQLVSHANEFASVRYGQGEKAFFSSLGRNPNIRYHLPHKPVTVPHKIFLVLQCVIGDINLRAVSPGSQLAHEALNITEQAKRIIKCVIECSVHEQNALKLEYALELYRSLQATTWADSPQQLRQVDSIGPQLVKRLAKAKIFTLDDIRNTDERRLEMIMHRNPPYGNKLKAAVDRIPQLEMTCNDGMNLDIVLSVRKTNVRSPKNGKGRFVLFWVAASDRTLHRFDRIPVREFYQESRHVHLTLEDCPRTAEITCHFQSEDYVGMNVSTIVKPRIDSAASKDMFPDLDDPFLDSLDKSTPTGICEEVCPSAPANCTSTMASSTFEEDIKRCKHKCKEKHLCGHSCCKIGLHQVVTVDKRKTSNEQSYIRKRIKMQQDYLPPPLLSSSNPSNDISECNYLASAEKCIDNVSTCCETEGNWVDYVCDALENKYSSQISPYMTNESEGLVSLTQIFNSDNEWPLNPEEVSLTSNEENLFDSVIDDGHDLHSGGSPFVWDDDTDSSALVGDTSNVSTLEAWTTPLNNEETLLSQSLESMNGETNDIDPTLSQSHSSSNTGKLLEEVSLSQWMEEYADSVGEYYCVAL